MAASNGALVGDDVDDLFDIGSLIAPGDGPTKKKERVALSPDVRMLISILAKKEVPLRTTEMKLLHAEMSKISQIVERCMEQPQKIPRMLIALDNDDGEKVKRQKKSKHNTEELVKAANDNPLFDPPATTMSMVPCWWLLSYYEARCIAEKYRPSRRSSRRRFAINRGNSSSRRTIS